MIGQINIVGLVTERESFLLASDTVGDVVDDGITDEEDAEGVGDAERDRPRCPFPDYERTCSFSHA